MADEVAYPADMPAWAKTDIDTHKTSGGAWAYRFKLPPIEYGGGAYATKEQAFTAGFVRLCLAANSR